MCLSELGCHTQLGRVFTVQKPQQRGEELEHSGGEAVSGITKFTRPSGRLPVPSAPVHCWAVPEQIFLPASKRNGSETMTKLKQGRSPGSENRSTVSLGWGQKGRQRKRSPLSKPPQDGEQAAVPGAVDAR